MLVEKGADVEAQGGYYRNAFQAASSRGHNEIAWMRADKGADANAQGSVPSSFTPGVLYGSGDSAR
jgi:hypothetical protein